MASRPCTRQITASFMLGGHTGIWSQRDQDQGRAAGGWGPGDPRWQGLPLVSCSSERVGAQRPWTTLKLTESSLLGAPYGCEMPLGCAQRGNSRGRKERVLSPSLPRTYCQVGSSAGGLTTPTFQETMKMPQAGGPDPGTRRSK